MRRIVLLAIGAQAAFAASRIELADGRVLRDASILSQTPLTVIVKYEGGLCSVEKHALPADLQAKYPIDEAGAREADERLERAATARREVERAAAEERSLLQDRLREEAAARLDDARSAAALREREQAAQNLVALKAQAASLIARHFRAQSTLGTVDVSCFATISGFRPVNGDAGPWLVSGTVETQSRNLEWGEPRRRYDDSRGRGSIGTRENRQWRRGRPDTSETREFEAVVTLEGPEPSVTILR